MTYVTIDTEVTVNLGDFSDQEIEDEYLERFDNLPSDIDWEHLFYIRRDEPLTEFLMEIDKIILNMSGRVM
jgi:hypothetical protein